MVDVRSIVYYSRGDKAVGGGSCQGRSASFTAGLYTISPPFQLYSISLQIKANARKRTKLKKNKKDWDRFFIKRQVQDLRPWTLLSPLHLSKVKDRPSN